MHVIKLQVLAFKSILLPGIMVCFEPEVLQNGRKFEARIKTGKCDVD